MTDPNSHNRLVVVSNPTAVKNKTIYYINLIFFQRSNKIRVSVDLVS